VRGIEAAPADDILFDIPSHSFGCLDAALIAVAGGDFIDRIHLPSPVAKLCAICRSAGGRESMTGPPGDMTETPDPDTKAVWTRYPTS
jgi:hypothetical protein